MYCSSWISYSGGGDGDDGDDGGDGVGGDCGQRQD